MKGLFYLVVTMVVIIACTNEEFDANSEVKKEEVKTKIASLAEKYDVNVDFFEINPSEKTENEMSLEEIEELFRDIKQLREHPVELKMYKDKEENGCMFYSTKEQKPSVPLAKTRSEIYSFSDWIWNLTWFSVTLIEDNKNVTVLIPTPVVLVPISSFQKPKELSRAQEGTLPMQSSIFPNKEI